MNFKKFSLSEWLHYLENRHSEEIQLGLARIKTVAANLDLLHPDATVFSIAGTNGKGSTVEALEAIYLAAGYQVASYTSPHLIRFNERIRVNHQPISDKKLCEAFMIIEEARANIHLTYFEVVTLAALWYFKQFKLDVIILEVGMGGRLDATNIIDSDMAIITTVDLDHQDYLGDTKEAIGYEKAGMLRTNKPFIYADIDPPDSIIQQARLLNAPRLSYSLKLTENSMQLLTTASINDMVEQNSEMVIDQPIILPRPNINPKAAAAAVMASAFFQATLPINFIEWSEAMRTVTILGRQQLIEGRVSVLFDVAHNPQAVNLLAESIKKYEIKGKVHAVFSGLKDKDLHGLIRPMQSCVDFWYPSVLSSKRAASESLLKAVFQSENCSIPAYFSDPLTAYKEAMLQAKTGDLIVVYGSFLTVSAVMARSIERQEEELR